MATKSNSSSMTGNKNRRSNKPLMEKRRRERINKSLNSLKELVLVAEQRDISKFNKLEKADILEMTVRHVRFLHEKTSDIPNRQDDCIARYKEGFDRCTKELLTYFNSTNTLSQDTISGVLSYLNSLSQNLNSKDACCTHSSPSFSVMNSINGNGTKHESKVKAAIDTSVFRSGVIRHENSEERLPSPTPLTEDCSSVLRAKECAPQVKSAFPEGQSIKLEFVVPPHWGGGNGAVLSFPPSPPDSSRCSSSPDSLRGSPRVFWDQGVSSSTAHYNNNNNSSISSNSERQAGSHPFMAKVAVSGKENHPFPLLQSASQLENRPLNLSISSSSSSSYSPYYSSSSPLPTRRGESAISPLPLYTAAINSDIRSATPSRRDSSSPGARALIKREPHNPILSPPSGSSSTSPCLREKSGGNDRHHDHDDYDDDEGVAEGLGGYGNAHQRLEVAAASAAGPSRGHSFKSGDPRPTPYPKKDAAKRYQNQNQGIANEFPPSIIPKAPSNPSPSTSHWRPW